jgi:hypothetical protein
MVCWKACCPCFSWVKAFNILPMPRLFNGSISLMQ